MGNAEHFYLELHTLKGYQLRIDAMVLRLDFKATVDRIKPAIEMYVKTCENLMDNEDFKSFLRFVLHTGNFLNSGKFAGNAAGFKINSLTKLMDTRANKPRVTLLHYLVNEVIKKNKDALAFVDELSPKLDVLNRLTLDNLTTEFSEIHVTVESIDKQLKSSSDEIRQQFESFVTSAKEEMSETKKGLQKIRDMSSRVAMHFCENESSFKLEEFISIMKSFFEKVKQCKKENEQRRLQEEKAERRRKAQAEISAKPKEPKKMPSQEDDGCIIDKLLNEIRKGYTLRSTSKKKSESTC